MSGNVSIVATVTDSRGRSASKTSTVNILPYSPPKITKFTLERCNPDGTINETGTHVKVSGHGNVSSLEVGGVQKNNLTYRLKYKSKNSSNWQMALNKTINELSLKNDEIISSFNIENSYDFIFEIVDKFNTTLSVSIIPTGSVTMSLSKEGIGVGKIWERGTLDVEGPVWINVDQPSYSGDLNVIWTYPQPFSEVPTVLAVRRQAELYATKRIPSITVMTQSVDEASISLQRHTGDVFVATDKGLINAFAIGRWK